MLGGLSLGEQLFKIITAGTVVTKDVPPYFVVEGVPAKINKE
ncbi:hypothetical protein [Methanoplanus endosymbiosus]|nr:hypothetical protein [Methanoplanus endosymbiosus]